MEHDEIKLETYTNVLNGLPRHEQSHLLLGNGFNASLGIKTDYENIFNEMKNRYPAYENIESELRNKGYDIEAIMAKLKSQIIEGTDYQTFLSQYISKKIKLDFMKATQSIMSSKIGTIYKSKNQGIYQLLEKFANYFTLNYDLFLYWLLMKFKSDNFIEIVPPQAYFDFKRKDLDQKTKEEVFRAVETAYDRGYLEIVVNGDERKWNLRKVTKTRFKNYVKHYFNRDNFPNQYINEAVDHVLESRNRDTTKNTENLLIRDGFTNSPDPIYDEEQSDQNLFFLHGAFHLYQKGGRVHKITRQMEKPLYERVETIINSEEEDVVCVFEGSSSDKIGKIKEIPYLQIAHQKLSTLRGTLVILGCSLSDNDRHVFEQINKSNIDSVYISSCEETKLSDHYKAIDLFPSKSIILFNYNDISYE